MKFNLEEKDGRDQRRLAIDSLHSRERELKASESNDSLRRGGQGTQGMCEGVLQCGSPVAGRTTGSGFGSAFSMCLSSH